MLPLHLTLHNKYGSSDHYYHFLLGQLLPLIYTRYITKPNAPVIYVKSCGKMDTHINALNIPGVCIVSPKEHNKMRKKCEIECLKVEGYDIIPGNRDKILISKEILSAQFNLQNTIPIENKILLINRLPPCEYYTTHVKEKSRVSGAYRRSIPNFNELVGELSFLKPTVATLEDTTLESQAQLFNTHNIIVAQHGAALSNVIFCNPKTNIFEISPCRERCYQCLTNLSMGIYHRVNQLDDHHKIDTNQIFKIITNTIVKRYENFEYNNGA